MLEKKCSVDWVREEMGFGIWGEGLNDGTKGNGFQVWTVWMVGQDIWDKSPLSANPLPHLVRSHLREKHGDTMQCIVCIPSFSLLIILALPSERTNMVMQFKLLQHYKVFEEFSSTNSHDCKNASGNFGGALGNSGFICSWNTNGCLSYIPKNGWIHRGPQQ